MSSPDTTGDQDRSTDPPSAPLKVDLNASRSVAAAELMVRFGFGFAVSVAAGIIVKAAGPAYGGMFLAFPAILPATTTLLQRRAGLAQACADIRGATVGALGMIVFAWAAWKILGSHSAPVSLAIALLAWIIASGTVFGLMRAVVYLLGENQYLPEIPTREAAAVLDALRARSLTIATAESCTGGLMAGYFASVPGASDALRGSIVAYQPDIKADHLDVPHEVLSDYGEISAPVAASMARGARDRLHADVGLGVTGNTGAASDGKPAGLTYIAVATEEGTFVRRYDDDHGPGRNDERAIRMAFQLVTDVLDGHPGDEHNVSEVATSVDDE